MAEKTKSLLLTVSDMLHEHIKVISHNKEKTMGSVTKVILRRIEEKHKDLLTKNNNK